MESSRSSTGDGTPTGHRHRVVRNHDMEGRESLSTSVALALATGTDALELARPLSDVVDPDALDALFEPLVEGETGDATLSFRYQDSEVTVRADGRIEVDRS